MRPFTLLAGISFLGTLCCTAVGQAPAFISFSRTGGVMWTNAGAGGVAVVEELSSEATGAWITVHAEIPTGAVSQADLVVTNSEAWFRLVHSDGGPAPTNMVWIPAGSFRMGEIDTLYTYGEEMPEHTVYVSGFFMDRYEVTNDEMVRVMQWAYDHGRITATTATVENVYDTYYYDPMELLDLDRPGCRITWDGSSFGMKPDKGAGYPCVAVSWFGAVAYCNYRSEMEGLTPCYDLNVWTCNWEVAGYRLPTESEWEKAGRAGARRQRFPWGEVIDHSRANYRAAAGPYDASPYATPTYHPDYHIGDAPYTSPVGSFPANAYGLFDMTGNVFEWCWDWWHWEYPDGPLTNPRGPSLPSTACRVMRGGSYSAGAIDCRVSARNILAQPNDSLIEFGLRAVLCPGP